MTCPCKGCEKAGCGAYHDTCPKYQEWVKEREKVASRRKAAQEVTDAVVRGKLRIKKMKGLIR